LITEEIKDKDTIIAKATMTKYISLVIREFGRGTDFICRDDIVNKNGGIVII
jgi:hypothetical protein